jgi:primosomal protein N' (replication factor Y)
MSRARVLLLNAALGPLDYRVPHGMGAKAGSIVVAPLGPRQLIGVVWDEGSFPDVETVGDNRLRNLAGVVDAPPLPEPLRRLIEWTADYYLSPPAAVLRMSLASMSALEGARTVIEYRASGSLPERMTEQRTQAMERIGERQGLVRELAMVGGVSDAVIRGLIKAGAFEPVEVSIDTPFPEPDPNHAPPVLSAAQAAAAAELTQAVDDGAFAPVLLDGVTGSGKTEVYFEAIAAAIREDRQILVLLPEIALTEPFLERFEKRFGCAPVNWHSGLRQSERRRAWRAIASGQARVVVGARSALFLPYPKLGLIVVDEAHEASFKQEDGVHYHARDVAVMRGLIEKFPVILASATPAIETRHQVEIGRYREIKLPSRFGGAQMPDIRGINLLTDPPERGRWIAPPLVAAIDETMAKGEQSLLFLNRRGYAPLTLCRHCGYRYQCPNCTAWMVEHRLTKRLACHHCGHVTPTPRFCQECKEEDSLVACGPGVERIADEVKALWPQARTAIVTSDTLWSPAKVAEFVKSVEAGDIDIIVGTQLDARRGGRRRPGAGGRRPARVGADLPADRPGRGARRAGAEAGPRVHPDANARFASHSITYRRRCGTLLRGGNGESPARAGAALRPLRRDHRVERGCRRGGADRPADRQVRADDRGDARLRPRPRAPLRAARTAPPPAARPCDAATGRAGRDPRLAGRRGVESEHAGDGRRRSL